MLIFPTLLSVAITVSFPSSGLLISPALFANNMLLIYTQSLVYKCVCVFVFSSVLRVNACMFGCICFCECTSFSAIFSVVKQEGEPERVPWWRTLTMSILLPDICLTGAVGRVGQACAASPPPPLPYVLLCSEKDEMLQYLYNGLMVLLGLPAIWNAPKHGPCAKFQTKILLFFLGIYSNKHTLFCVTAPKKTKVLIKQRLALTEIMFGWNAVQNNPQREHQSNERLLFSFSLDFISSVTPADLLYIIYCCCFAQIRNLTNSIRI